MIKKRKKKDKKGKKKAMDLGSSRNHLSFFIRYTFNTKTFIYHYFGKSSRERLK